MSASRSWTFDYAGPPDEGATEPPHIWVEITGPAAGDEYPCLVDSGASFSALPLSVADELGIDRSELEQDSIRTVAGPKQVLHLRRRDQIWVVLDSDERTPISPYFFPNDVIEGEEFESDYYILGRDFFLPYEITFNQAAEDVVIALR